MVRIVSCCNWIPWVYCAGPADPPSIVSSAAEVARLVAASSMTTALKYYAYSDASHTWCYTFDPTAAGTCAFPDGAILVSLAGNPAGDPDCTRCSTSGSGSGSGHGTTFGGGGGGGPGGWGLGGGAGGGGGPGGGGGTGLPGTGTGTGSGPPKNGVPVFGGTDGDGNQIGAVACSGQTLPPNLPPYYVDCAALPTDGVLRVWRIGTICVMLDPTEDCSDQPSNAVAVSPADDYPDCATCLAGVLAVLCAGNRSPSKAPKGVGAP